MDKTLAYYNEKANEFVNSTVKVEFTEIEDLFLKLIPERGKILDFGCGSGRDTKYFWGKGYEVEATDGSEELCKFASEYTGIKVKKMLFQELDETDKYDGIWACSSILHLPKDELLNVFRKMLDALKTNGVIYTSFKYGEAEGFINERYFSNFKEASFKAFIAAIEAVGIEQQWVTTDVRPGRGGEKWLNLILRKLDIN